MQRHILELALEALSARKAAIDAEIETLKRGLSSGAPSASRVAKVATPKKPHPKQSPAARKAQSERMKAYWAKKKAAAAKRARGRAKKR